MANRYLVSSGDWNSTARWSATLGGASGASIPTSADLVVLPNAFNLNVPSAYTASCAGIDCTGYTGTLSSTDTSSNIISQGSITLSSTMTLTMTGYITFTVSSTITANGKSMGTLSYLSINGTGITLTLGGALTANISIGAGTLALGTFTLTCPSFFQFSNAAGTRAITRSTGNIVLTGTGTIFSAGTTGTNTLPNSNLPISSTGAGARVFSTGNIAFTSANSPNLSISGSSTITGITTANNIDFTGFTGSWVVNASTNLYGGLIMSASMTSTSTNVVNFISTAITNTLSSLGATLDAPVTFNSSLGKWTLSSNFSVGTTRTTTLTSGTLSLSTFTLSTGVFDSNTSTSRTLDFGVGGTIALTCTVVSGTALQMATVTSLTFTGSGTPRFTTNALTTLTFSFGSTAGGSATVNADLVASSGTGSLSLTTGSYFRALTLTGNSSTVASANVNIAGNITLSSTGTYTGLSITTVGITSSTIASSGKSIASLIVNGSSSSKVVSLSDALSITGASGFVMTAGSFNGNGFNVTTTIFTNNAGVANTLTLGSGTWTITSANAGISWRIVSTPTFVSTGSTISMSGGGTAQGFYGGGLTYNVVRQANSATLTITGANTFATLSNTVSPTSVVFPSSVTQTITTSFALTGTSAANLCTITASTPGTRANLSKSGTAVSVNYCSIKDSNATGGATWNALLLNGNVNAGNNAGWIFSSNTGAMLMMFQ